MKFSILPADAIAAELGVRLRRQRLHKNLTQADLAVMAGVSTGAIRQLERDGQSSMTTFLKVVHALGMIRELESLFLQRPQSLAELERLAATSERQRARKKSW